MGGGGVLLFQEVGTMKSLHWRCEMWLDCVERKRRARLLASAMAPRAFAAAPSFQACVRAYICTFCMCVCIYVYVCMCADMYRMKIAFIITRKGNNVLVSFGTLKVQSFMLTEVRDCDLLIVVTSSTFLKRKDMLKEKRQLAHIIKARSPAYI